MRHSVLAKGGLVIGLLLIVAGVTLSEGQGEVTPRVPGGGPAEIDETYVLVAPHIGIQYWQVHKAGLEAAAAELGVKTVFTGVMGDSVEDQASIMDQLIVQQPAGILVGPLNAQAMTPSINRAIAAGIPVITVDTDAPESDRLAYIGTDGYTAGQIAADHMAELLGEQGDVGISNLVGFDATEQRAIGFRDRIAERYPRMRVVAEVDDKADPEIATKVNTEMLIANPSIRGVFGTNAVSPIGMGSAVRSLNRAGQIALVGFDPMPQTLQLIGEGVIDATMVQRTYAMSYYALKMLYDYNRGSLELVKGWDVLEAQSQGINTLPQIIDTGIMVVTAENYEFFEEE
ncbi:MAG: substrate-binding domain-containing protein [Spirochaetaceae bacterium]